MRVFVQRVDKGHAFCGAQGIPAQKGRHGLQGGALPAAENFLQVKAQQAFAVPLAAVNKNNLKGGQQQYEAGRLRTCEYVSVQKLFKTGSLGVI